MTTSEYAHALKTTNGLRDAIKIAEQSMKASNLLSWKELPLGTIYYAPVESRHRLTGVDKQYLRTIERKEEDKLLRSTYILKHKEIQKTYTFWKEVFHILKKL